MLKHFTGTHDHKLDDKGRVSLPTEFRRVLSTVGSTGALYIIPQLEDRRAHVVVTVEGYDKLVARHDAAIYDSPREQRRMEAALFSRVVQVQVDDNGRLVISKKLRDAIELDKDIRFVGKSSRFEVWCPDAHDAYEAELEGGDDDPPYIDLRGLHA